MTVKKGWIVHCLGAVLIVVYFAAFLIKAADYSVWKKALVLSPSLCILLIVYSLLNYLLRAFRWSLLIRQSAEYLSHSYLVLVYFFGFLFSASPGKLGEVFRCYLLRKHSVTYSESLAVLFFERLGDLVVIILLVLAIYSTQYLGFIYPVVILFCGGIFILFKLNANCLVMNELMVFVRGVTDRLSALASGRNIAVLIALGLLAWVVQALVLFELLCVNGVFLPLILVIGIYSLSLLLGALSMLPGGIGVVELSLVVLLVGSGVSEEVAVTCSLLTRVFTLWLSIVVGAISSLIYGLLAKSSKI